MNLMIKRPRKAIHHNGDIGDITAIWMNSSHVVETEHAEVPDTKTQIPNIERGSAVHREGR